MWADIHMLPSESAQAHLDVKASYLLPIHNGTFDLSLHTWTDPFEQISSLARELEIQLLTPSMGQPVSLNALQEHGASENAWWRDTD